MPDASTGLQVDEESAKETLYQFQLQFPKSPNLVLKPYEHSRCRPIEGILGDLKRR